MRADRGGGDGGRRGLLRAGLATAAVSAARPALALMAGEPPDSPERRVDPNLPGSPFSGVGSIEHAGGGVVTGTLIAPRFVLTAAHAVGAAEELRFNLNLDGPVPLALPVRRVLRHPRFAGVNDVHADFDLALLELVAAAPVAARRYPLYYGPLAVGQRIVLAGYGASGAGSRGPEVGAAATVKRRGANVIAQLVDPLPEAAAEAPATSRGARGMPGTYLFAFRRPPEGNPTTAASLGNAIETGLAPGDSGSPAFVGNPAGLRLMGVNTFVGRDPRSQAPSYGYGSLSGGCVVGRHLRWIWREMSAIRG